MKHQFLILSYLKDYPWLWHCLRSVKKFARGYGVTIVVPDGQAQPPRDMIEQLEISNAEVKTDAEPAGLGQLFSQVTKCSADVFVPKDTEFVHFLDSDTILPYPCVPELFMRGEKLIMPYNSYAHLRENKCGTAIWQSVVEKNLCFPVANEFMRQAPLAYPRAVFQALRCHIESVHRMRFADYVFGTGKNSWPQNFCESNVLAAYAWEKMHDAYHWSCLDHGPENGVERWRFIQFWSHGGLDRPHEFSSEAGFGGVTFGPKDTPRQIIERVLGR